MKVKRNVVLPLSKIHPNIANPRKGSYDESEMEELKENMKAFGLLTNLKVDKQGNILGGHRRYQAAKEMGWDKLRCDVYEIESAFDKSSILISDNTTQKQFNPWDYRKAINDIYWNEFCEEYKFKGEHDKGYAEFGRKISIPEQTVRKIIESMSKENLSIQSKLEGVGAGVEIFDHILTTPKKYKMDMTNKAVELMKKNKDKSQAGVRENLRAFKKILIARESKKELHPKFYSTVYRTLDHCGVLLTDDILDKADATTRETIKKSIEKNILRAYKKLGGK